MSVAPLGRTSEVMYALRPADTLFTDTMGDVTAISLGMAMAAAPLSVVGIDTDGGFLMNLSVLTALGDQLPRLGNYTLAVIDNHLYESGGGLPSRGAALDWSALFGAVGLKSVLVEAPHQVPEVLPLSGTVLIASVHNPAPVPDALKTVDGVESSYQVERVLAERTGRTPRRPALKP
ncbi:thiamine pyrophosphate-dependent enzyme [Kitasatospora sp. NPDC057512]|uniref:thiamine pyrophosphate-dependent enzyme n=1 Tax=Kitasatospora sp. NPDC057512 TaxID=3346154 RepID=UPI0036B07014